MDRIARIFATLREAGEKALVTFVTAGDPDYATSLEILKGLPKAGADIIELGMPFSDPMADGPAIQRSSQRALRGGQNMLKTLEMVRSFRETDKETPVILMGYYNPIYVFPVDAFLARPWKLASMGSSWSMCRRRQTTSFACRRCKPG